MCVCLQRSWYFTWITNYEQTGKVFNEIQDSTAWDMKRLEGNGLHLVDIDVHRFKMNVATTGLLAVVQVVPYGAGGHFG